MKRATATYGLAASLTFAGGCAPSFEGLVRDRHYGEAMAAMAEAQGSDFEKERAELVRALEADLDPALHAVALSQQMLQEQLGPAADSLNDALVVRLHMTTNAAPIRSVSFDVRLRSGERPVATVPIYLAALAKRTGETLPKTVVEHVTTSDPVQRGVHATAEAGWWALLLLTGGLSGAVLEEPGPLPPPERHTTVTVPSRSDIAAHAPRALTLFEALHMQRRGASSSDFGPDYPPSNLGVPIDANVDPVHEHALVVWKRDRVRAEGPLALDVSVTAYGKRGYVKIFRTIELPKGPSIEARFAARFGSAELPLRGLGPSRVVWPSDEPLGKVLPSDVW
jgi:hypothetical protein